MKIPYYEKIHNDFIEGRITRTQLDDMCNKDLKLKKWIQQYNILKEVIKDLKYVQNNSTVISKD
jgi:hypothetical protein